MSNTRKSLLELAEECDNFPYYSESPTKYEEITSGYYQFRITGCNKTLGYVVSSVAEKFATGGIWILDKEQRFLTLHIVDSDLTQRNKAVAESLQSLQEAKIFKVLSGWRNELYPIYGPGREILLSMERSATPLLGVVTYGVHMTAFVRTSGANMKIWVPRRSETKQTYPGMMDNTVAGGLSAGENPFECLIREAAEEASLPEVVARRAKACGTLTYFHVRDARAGGETGLCQPECQYIYDLELPEDITPKPNDNEAVDFRLLSMEEVQAAMAEGRFKPNCALLLIEFMIRHGIVTPENEPEYIKIVARCHRNLEFPTP